MFMYCLKKSCLVLVCALALMMTMGTAITADEKTGFQERMELLDTYLERMTGHGYSGVMLVGLGEDILLHKAYGLADREAGVPMTTDMLQNTASMTKQFTGAALALLIQQGKLHADDTLGMFFDNLPEHKAGITVQQLANHTSGLVDYVFRFMELSSVEEAVAHIADMPLTSEPGSTFAYNNGGYNILARIIEKVSGQGYEAFVREKLFVPAGLELTGYQLPDWSGRTSPIAYSRGERTVSVGEMGGENLWMRIGAGGMLTTAEELFRWHRALMRDDILNDIGKAALYRQGLRDYSMGWTVRETEHGTLINHNGGTHFGYSGEFIRFVDEDIAIIYFCTAAPGSRPMSSILKQPVIDIVFGKTVTLPPVQTEINADAQRFTGRYSLGGDATITISSPDGNGLVVEASEAQVLYRLMYPMDASRESSAERLLPLSLRILSEALVGSYTTVKADVANGENVAASLSRNLGMFERMGLEVDGVGASAAWMEEDTLLVAVELLMQDHGADRYIFHWNPESNSITGMELQRHGLKKQLTFQPVGEARFVHYDVETGLELGLGFRLDEDGVTGIMIRTPSGFIRGEPVN